MTSYRVHSPNIVVLVIEAGDLVVQSGPLLHWSVGRTFTSLRDYCKARGWLVEPLINPNPVTWLEDDNVAYELHWHKGRITRITRHDSDSDPVDVRFSDLPENLKALL